jgi:putative ABC transport system permease protein
VVERYPDGLPELTGIAPTEWLPSLAPAEVLETERASSLIWSVIGLLGLTVLATLGHTLASGVRQHRGDYAVLKALGFTRRQVLGAVAWQSLATMAIALVVALPLGTALGRSVWRLFAQVVGVIDTPVVPLLALAGVAVGALVATGLIATVPGLVAARTSPAAVLREE